MIDVRLVEKTAKFHHMHFLLLLPMRRDSSVSVVTKQSNDPGFNAIQWVT